jgi:alpha/beta superfamily hydrolase
MVTGEQAVTVAGLEGQPSIEARLSASPSAVRAVVLCHPHPLYGGTMHNPVVLAVAKVLAAWGGDRVAWLRFNYRGVGASGGSYDDGRGETLDARAVIREMKRRAPGAKLTVCGYSFGTWVGLRAAAIEGGVERVALIAPAVRIFHFVKEDAGQLAGGLAIFVGDRDPYCDVDEARALAEELGASLDVFADNDHFFLKSRRRLAERAVPFVAPEVPPEGQAP